MDQHLAIHTPGLILRVTALRKNRFHEEHPSTHTVRKNNKRIARPDLDLFEGVRRLRFRFEGLGKGVLTLSRTL